MYYKNVYTRNNILTAMMKMKTSYRCFNHAKRVALTMIFMMAAMPSLMAQGFFTLTNGRLYWYEHPIWDPGTGWSVENVGKYTVEGGVKVPLNPVPQYQTDVAVDRSKGYAQVHPYDTTRANITHIAEMGDRYLRLSIPDGQPENPSIEWVDTSLFDPFCAWYRTDRMGNYYQNHGEYNYYLNGEPGELTVRAIRVGSEVSGNTRWYDWDFGAAITKVSYLGTQRKESYHWLMYDTVRTSATYNQWTVSGGESSYQRPEDIIYNPYTSLAGLSGDELENAIAQNIVNRTYYVPNPTYANAGHGVGALFLPVDVVDHAREPLPLSADQGLMPQGNDRANNTTVRLKDSDPAVDITRSRMLAFQETATITPTLKGIGTQVEVQRAYTEYVQEIYRYGAHLNGASRTHPGFGSRGDSVLRAYYYYDDAKHTEKPGTDKITFDPTDIIFTLETRSSRALSLVTHGTGLSKTAEVYCQDVPNIDFDAHVFVTVVFNDGGNSIEVTDTLTIWVSSQYQRQEVPTEHRPGIEAPIIAGWVFGGGRMANVGGSTSVTLHSCDTVVAVYGGNDIAGWVQGSRGTSVQIGTAKTDATHPAHVGYVYGGGCGYYRYDGLFFPSGDAAEQAAYNAAGKTGVQAGSYCFNGKVYPWEAFKKDDKWVLADGETEAQPVVPNTFTYAFPGTTGGCALSDFMTCEDGEKGDGTLPYATSTSVTIGMPDNPAANNYILIDSVFGGAENAFVGTQHHSWDDTTDCRVTINGGAVLTVFGGNNYGGSVAPTSYTIVTVNDTKLTNATGGALTLDDAVNRPYSGYGRTFGVRHLFGGGNMVTSAHAEVNINGGMVDSCFLGGNRATVIRPVGEVNCTGTHFIYNNESLDALASGALNLSSITPASWQTLKEQNPGNFVQGNSLYNVRVLFGGNNRANMETFSQINLTSGGVGTIYGGGNMGDMTNTNPITSEVHKLYQVIKDAGVDGYVKDAVVSSEVKDALIANGDAVAADFKVYRDFADSIDYALGYKKYDGGTTLVPAVAGDEMWHYGNKPGSVGCFIRSYPGSHIIADNVYGGCRMASVKNSTGVWLSGGCFGYVQGGNDISGDVGTTTNEGTWVVLEDNVIVLQDVYGGSDGFYHCHKNGRYIKTDDPVVSYNMQSYDPYDDYLGLLTPTHNNTNLYLKGGTVLFSAYGGGVMTDVGFEIGRSYSVRNHLTGVDEALDLSLAGSRQGSIHFQLSGSAQIGSKYYHQNALQNVSLSGTAPAWRTDDLDIDGSMTGRARRAALVTRKNAHPAVESYDVVANHDGNAYGGGYLSSVYGMGYFYVAGESIVYGSLYAGNDCNGRIESYGNYTDNNTPDPKDYKASDGTPLNVKVVHEDGSADTYNSAYTSYVLIEGRPQITCVYGSGNGAYNYGNPNRPQYSSFEPVCLSSAEENRPEQSSTFIDVHTAGGFIDSVFGGGNGIGVSDVVAVLLNNQGLQNPDRASGTWVDRNGNTHTDNLYVGTIFGGNNLERMTCVPNIMLTQGMVKNVFGGGNAGAMEGRAMQYDLCGNPVDSISTYINITSANVTVADSVFGGCRMADVKYKSYIDVRNTSSGGINYIFGGNDLSGTVNGNTRIDVSGGKVKHIFGGSNGNYYYELPAGESEDYNVYAFTSDYEKDGSALLATGTTGIPNVDSTSINLYGGIIEAEVFGGGNLGDCRATQVLVNDMITTTDKSCSYTGAPLELTLQAEVYGGGKGIDSDLNKAHRGNVQGNDNGAGATHVLLHHATNMENAKAYGGGRGGDVDDTYITAYDTWEVPFSAIYGGCWGSDVMLSTHVTLEGKSEGITANYVYGGNDFTGNVYKTNVDIHSGTYGNIFGGGNGNYDASEYSPTDDTSPYYGANKRLFVPNNEFAVVNFSGGTVTGNLYGGGREGTTLRYKTDSEGAHIRDANGRLVPDTARADYAARNTNYTDPTDDFSYIIVNVTGGTFQHNIFAGAMGANKGPQLVYGLKELNMSNGRVGESIYGGSENVNDGYAVAVASINEDAATTATKTLKRPSSILNITGGIVTNNVYGGGYLGDIFGSVFVNVGVNAVENSKVWDMTFGGSGYDYKKFKPGYSGGLVAAQDANELQFLASVYSGANWGNNTGNSDFSKRGFYGGESHIHVDGLGYKTFMTEVGLEQMNIGKSLIGSGTSAEGGDVYSRIDLRNYGAINDRCEATRNLAAIQRANGVWLNNTAINYTGSTDAISAYLSNQITFNRIDTLNCVGYNVIDVNATITNIGEVSFYEQEPWPYNNLVLTTHSMTENATCSTDKCEQLNVLDRANNSGKQHTALVMNNGINVDFINETGSYAPIFGFAYVVAEENTNAVITALSKYTDGMWSATHNGNTEEYGGFLPSCSDSLQYITAQSGTHNEELTWAFGAGETSSQYPYSNYGTVYRVWTVGHGTRRRYAVILAHAEPEKLQPTALVDDPNKVNWLNQKIKLSDGTTYDVALAHSQLLLPPTTPGHYYKISAAGVTITDDNNEMNLADRGWKPTSWAGVTNNWDAVDAGGTMLGSGSPTGMPEINDNAGYYFGLTMASGDNFSSNKPETAGPEWTGATLLSGNFNVNELVDFSTAKVGDNQYTTPVLDLYLTYSPNFSNTLVGAVNFTLEEYYYYDEEHQKRKDDYDNILYYADANDRRLDGPSGYLVDRATGTKYVDANGVPLADQSDPSIRVRGNFDKNIGSDIKVEVTLSTILEEFNNMNYELLAMYNEGRSNLFSRKAILPATLEQREVYIEGIEWAPTNFTTGNGEYVNDGYNADKFYLTNDSVNVISKNNVFGLRFFASDDVSSTLVTSEGWYSRDISTPANIVTLAGMTGSTGEEVAKSGTFSAGHPDVISLINGENPQGMRVGVLDGRGEASINIEMLYDGMQIFPNTPGKGYVGKAILHMASYKPKMYESEDRNDFTITVFVKTREAGDTIYIASANEVTSKDYVEGVSGFKLTHLSNDAYGTGGGKIENRFKGKRPQYYVQTFEEALSKSIYQEGDVIAFLDKVTIGENQQTHVRGYEYMPIPFIRYYGHHSDFPGETCVYRDGPAVEVTGTGASFRATCIDFQGSAIGKLEKNAGTYTSFGEATKLDKNDKVKYTDTNVVYAPLIAISNGGNVMLENGTIVEENYNGYTASDESRMGAINVGAGGTLQLRNGVIVRNNLSQQLASHEAHHPTNGAVYVHGGVVELVASSSASELNITNNRLYNGGQYWTSVNHPDADANSVTLMRYAFDTTQTAVHDAQLANVWLERTESVSESDKVMNDQKSDVFIFSSELPKKWSIGVSKWFPGFDPLVRDTIQIAYNSSGSFTTAVYDNDIFFSDEGDFVFANTGVNPFRIYLQRCATFKMQSAGGAYPAYVTSVPALGDLQPGVALKYYANPDVTCPTGGDEITYRVQGGFFPYTYTWTMKEGDDGELNTFVRTTTGNNESILEQVAHGDSTGFVNAIKDIYTTSSIGKSRSVHDKVFNYTVEAVDITGHCYLRKNIQTTIKTDGTSNSWTTDNLGNWTSVEAANHTPVVTATGTRNFPGVKITPIVWSDRSLGTILVKTFEGVEKESATKDSVYIIDGVTRTDLDDVYFCQGDRIRLITTPHMVKTSESPETWEPTSKFIMWDFDPYYSSVADYTIPARNTTVVAYYGPFDYWKDVINTTTKGGVRYDNTDEYETNGSKLSSDKFVVTHHGNVHIYDEDGLAWFISSVNGLNGSQATQYYFNTVYLHKKSDGTPYDMKAHKWTPVGLSQHPFRGCFVGVGSTWNDTVPLAEKVVVKNILVDEPNADYAGFFGHLDKATIKNIELSSALIRGSQYVGAVTAEAKNTTFKQVAVSDAADDAVETGGVTTTTVLTTRHTSGGLAGKVDGGIISNYNVAAKYVGNAVYTGGVVGYGDKVEIADGGVRNVNVMQALYSGGIAGYLSGKAPVGLFGKKDGDNGKSAVLNNYVRFDAGTAGERVGGIVGFAKNTIIQNNYVYGQVDGTIASGAVAGEMESGTKAMYNYYASGTSRSDVGQQQPGTTLTETHIFSGSGNQVRLTDNSHGVNNLTRALNLWVRDQGDSHRTWRSDLEGTHDGYPLFGTPDLIPVRATVVLDGCDSVRVDSEVYYFDTEFESHVVDEEQMVDSTARVIVRVHYSTREHYADSTMVGIDYEGHGFTFTAAESELLRATIRQYGKASIILTDTLQSVSGCDSIVCLTLTVNDDGNSNLGTDEPEPVVNRRHDIKVYPNPTTSRVTVETEGIQHVELYDNEGRRLQDYTTDERDRIVIDLTGYATGAYYLRVHTDNEVTIQKLIKK